MKWFKQNSAPNIVPNPPSIHPRINNRRRVSVTIYCKNGETFIGVKVFKDNLIGLPTNKMRFIEVHEENRNKYHLIKVDDIEEIEYSKDEWED